MNPIAASHGARPNSLCSAPSPPLNSERDSTSSASRHSKRWGAPAFSHGSRGSAPRRPLPANGTGPSLRSSPQGALVVAARLPCGLPALRVVSSARGLPLSPCRLFRARNKRHTYAAHVLLRCYRSNGNPQAVLPVLSRVMGHVSLASTAYCLPVLDPLLEQAAQRVAQRIGPVLTGNSGGRHD